MADMPPLLGRTQIFLACLRSELPADLQEASEEFMTNCAEKANIPRHRLGTEVLYELPDCLLSREYRAFLATKTQGPYDFVGVAVTNVDDFKDAHGPGSVRKAIRHLQEFGLPCHYIRLGFEKQETSQPVEVHCVDFSRTNG